jgi:hypothetical protein
MARARFGPTLCSSSSSYRSSTALPGATSSDGELLATSCGSTDGCAGKRCCTPGGDVISSTGATIIVVIVVAVAAAAASTAPPSGDNELATILPA